jgi:hypothetical protein
VAHIRQRSEQQGSGSNSFILIRAERTDSKHLYGRGNAIRKPGRATRVIEDPWIKECRDISILSRAAEHRHISRNDLAVEQKLLSRRKERADASKHPLFVVAEFSVIREHIPIAKPFKTQTAIRRLEKNDLLWRFLNAPDDLDLTGG